jgi:hypothetical protein
MASERRVVETLAGIEPRDSFRAWLGVSVQTLGLPTVTVATYRVAKDSPGRDDRQPGNGRRHCSQPDRHISGWRTSADAAS